MKKKVLTGLIGILLLGLWSGIGLTQERIYTNKTNMWGVPICKTFRNEPKGFRGIKWGTNISTLKDMKCTWESWPGRFEEKYYVREREKLQIGKVKLKKIEYSFHEGRFWKVMIDIERREDYSVLLEIFKRRFGPFFHHSQWDFLVSENVEISGCYTEKPWFSIEWKKISETPEQLKKGKEEEETVKEGVKDEFW